MKVELTDVDGNTIDASRRTASSSSVQRRRSSSTTTIILAVAAAARRWRRRPEAPTTSCGGGGGNGRWYDDGARRRARTPDGAIVAARSSRWRSQSYLWRVFFAIVITLAVAELARASRRKASDGGSSRHDFSTQYSNGIGRYGLTPRDVGSAEVVIIAMAIAFPVSLAMARVRLGVPAGVPGAVAAHRCWACSRGHPADRLRAARRCVCGAVHRATSSRRTGRTRRPIRAAIGVTPDNWPPAGRALERGRVPMGCLRAEQQRAARRHHALAAGDPVPGAADRRRATQRAVASRRKPRSDSAPRAGTRSGV